MALISTLWECDKGRLYIQQQNVDESYCAVAYPDGLNREGHVLFQPHTTVSGVQIMFQKLAQEGRISSILDKDDDYIREVLQAELDFETNDGQTFRCFAFEGHLQIKFCGPGHGWKIYKRYEDIRKMAGDWNRLKFRLEVDKFAIKTIDGAHDGWPKGSAVEALEPVEVLPAVVVDHTAAAVVSQYKRAISGTLEIIRFGAMLIEIDTCLTREIGATKRYTNTGNKQSLKGWMEDNCPEINYKTAIRYKTLAQGLQDMFKIPAKLPLTLALPASDGTVDVCIPDSINISEERVRKIQVAVWEMVEGKSARQLLFDFGIAEPKRRGGAREGAGRPQAQLDSELAAGAAWGRIGPAIDRATAWHFERFLPEAMVREALSTIDLLHDALKARLVELSGKGQ